jgi:hypothetical protein
MEFCASLVPTAPCEYRRMRCLHYFRFARLTRDNQPAPRHQRNLSLPRYKDGCPLTGLLNAIFAKTTAGEGLAAATRT